MSGLMVCAQPYSINRFSVEQNDHLLLDSPSSGCDRDNRVDFGIPSLLRHPTEGLWAHTCQLCPQCERKVLVQRHHNVSISIFEGVNLQIQLLI